LPAVLRSSWLLLLYLSFLGLGITTPFVMTLGYVWVDTFQPQSVAYFILNELPIAFIMGAAAVVTYILLDRRSPPPLMLATVCMIGLAIWMTAALLWAELPTEPGPSGTGPSRRWCSPHSSRSSSVPACK